MKDKVLVLGSAGLIGHQVYNYLKHSDCYSLYNISHQYKIKADTILLNVRDESTLVEVISKIRPKFIVNCIGILINGSNEDPENAIFLNSYIPHRLVRIAEEINAKLIHISTDCVFSGDKQDPYIESDEKDGRGIYAKTKGLGEIVNDRHLTLRTSVVGPELKKNGEELFNWFMSQKGEISGYTNAIWSGVTSLELAKAVKWSMDHDVTGLYHVTNNAVISKFELLHLFKKYTKIDVNIVPFAGICVNKSFIDTRLLIGYKIPSYEEMIANMISLIRENRRLYSQYKLGIID